MLSKSEYIHNSCKYQEIKYPGKKWQKVEYKKLDVDYIKKITNVMNIKVMLFFDKHYIDYIKNLQNKTFNNKINTTHSITLHTNYNVYAIITIIIRPLKSQMDLPKNRLLEVILTGIRGKKIKPSIFSSVQPFNYDYTNVLLDVKWVNTNTNRTIDVRTSTFEQQMKFWLDADQTLSVYVLKNYYEYVASKK